MASTRWPLSMNCLIWLTCEGGWNWLIWLRRKLRLLASAPTLRLLELDETGCSGIDLQNLVGDSVMALSSCPIWSECELWTCPLAFRGIARRWAAQSQMANESRNIAATKQDTWCAEVYAIMVCRVATHPAALHCAIQRCVYYVVATTVSASYLKTANSYECECHSWSYSSSHSVPCHAVQRTANGSV